MNFYEQDKSTIRRGFGTSARIQVNQGHNLYPGPASYITNIKKRRGLTISKAEKFRKEYDNRSAIGPGTY